MPCHKPHLKQIIFLIVFVLLTSVAINLGPILFQSQAKGFYKIPLIFFYYLFLILLCSRNVFLNIFLYLLLIIGLMIGYYSYQFSIEKFDSIALITALSNFKIYSGYFISLPVIIFITIYSILYLYATQVSKKIQLSKKIIILLLIYIAVISFFEKKYFPQSIFGRLSYLSEQFNMPEKIDLSKKYLFQDGTDDITLVLIRTDSIRSDKLGLNNYQRNTTPMLSNLGNQIISFKNVHSFRNSTDTSLGFIYTRFLGNEDKLNFKEKSFISIFNHLNYQTSYISINDQEIGIPQTNPASGIALEAKLVFNQRNIEKKSNYGVIYQESYKGIDGLTHIKFLDLLHQGLLGNKSMSVISHCCAAHASWDYLDRKSVV